MRARVGVGDQLQPVGPKLLGSRRERRRLAGIDEQLGDAIDFVGIDGPHRYHHVLRSSTTASSPNALVQLRSPWYTWTPASAGTGAPRAK